MTEDEI